MVETVRVQCLVVLLCLGGCVRRTEGFSLKESYANFWRGGGSPELRGNSQESTESSSSYEGVEGGSQELPHPQPLTMNLDPTPTSPTWPTHFVTATKYDDFSTASEKDEESQVVEPSTPTTLPSTETESPEQVDTQPSASSTTSTMTTAPFEEESVSPTIAVPVVEESVSNDLEAEPTSPAELVSEPIPTPMALISSNGEGSNPPLEEEFAEAFKKVGPNGRRRRIRPGGGRGRRVRMRVKKVKEGENSGESETGNGEPTESEVAQPERRRRYRSTTTTPPPTPGIREEASAQVGPKPQIMVQGNSGLINSNELGIEEGRSAGGMGGYTEKISTYLMTPPPLPNRISTTALPHSQEIITEGLTTFATEVPTTTSGTTPTSQSGEHVMKSESVRNVVVQTPMMDRAYSVAGFDQGQDGHPFTTPSEGHVPFFRSPPMSNSNGQDDFGNNGGNYIGGYNSFGEETHQRSHYDRNKDGFFGNQQELPDQLPVFDPNGYATTPANSNQEPYFSPQINDYGSETHYTPNEFRGSPMDPVQGANGGPMNAQFTQVERPEFGVDGNNGQQGGQDPNIRPEHTNPNFSGESSSQSYSPYEGRGSSLTPYAHQSENDLNHQFVEQQNFTDPNEMLGNHNHNLGDLGMIRPIENQVQAPPPHAYNNGPPPQYQGGPGGPGPGHPFFGRGRPHHPMYSPPPPPHFFRNSAPPPPMHLRGPPPPGARVPLPNTPLYSVAAPTGPEFPMTGLANIPHPPNEQEALSQVQGTLHFPPHAHSMSDKPDYEPANPPLPPELGSGGFSYSQYANNGEEPLHHNHVVVEHPPQIVEEHHIHHYNTQQQEMHPHPHHQHHENMNMNMNMNMAGPPNPPQQEGNKGPGYDILSAYYDKPPPTVGGHPNANHNDYGAMKDSHLDSRPPLREHQGNSIDEQEEQNGGGRVPYQYTSSDGGGLDVGIPQRPEPQEEDKGKKNEEKNLTAMYSETPYVLMFPQLVPEEAMIPPPPKILTKEIPVVQASSMSSMQFTPEGKPVLGPGLKAVPVHPRQQLYQVLAKAHYDQKLKQYQESRKRPPSAIYTPYGILVPVGPSGSAAASTNHEKYVKGIAKLKSAASSSPSHNPSSYKEHERQLLHLLLGKKSPLGHFHLFKSASMKNGRLQQQFDFKANVDPALDILSEKLALKLSAAKYLLSAPAKLGFKAFTKHATSYSEHKPNYISPTVAALGSELRDLLSQHSQGQEMDTMPSTISNQQKGDGSADPALKSELKHMLKERLREILEENEQATEAMEREKLAALASSIAATRVTPQPTSPSVYSKVTSYLSPSSGGGNGLFGTIKRLFFGGGVEEGGETFHPFGGVKSTSLYGSVGRTGLAAPVEDKGGREQRVKKQLERWLSMVLSRPDMATSESVAQPVYALPEGKRASLASFALPQKEGRGQGKGPFNYSSWTPIVSSALKSVFSFNNQREGMSGLKV